MKQCRHIMRLQEACDQYCGNWTCVLAKEYMRRKSSSSREKVVTSSVLDLYPHLRLGFLGTTIAQFETTHYHDGYLTLLQLKLLSCPGDSDCVSQFSVSTILPCHWRQTEVTLVHCSWLSCFSMTSQRGISCINIASEILAVSSSKFVIWRST
jgi:hypothetical protein